jgi:hypothetical protein
MLHVTNGDCAADQIRAAGVGGEVLPWRDVLHDGPVPAGLAPAELRRVRARWLAAFADADPDAVAAEIEERDGALAAARGRVVLWFEHDLYDQLQLIQVLDALEFHEPLALINPGEYLGYMDSERLAALFAERRPVTPAQRALARRAWAAFRAPDPREVQRVAEGDTAALPFLGAALRRHLEQFPHVRDGLSRSERQLLEAVEGGAATVRAAFAEHQRREDPIWLGDWSCWGYVRVLADGPRPLLRIHPAESWLDAALEVTPTGRDVLAGRADRVRENGIDRWLGGVHLEEHGAVWRWNGEECVSA